MPRRPKPPLTRFDDIGKAACETRPWVNAGGHRSVMGRSSFLICCPFCKGETRAFTWSLCGGGKRCENRACGALFGGRGDAYRMQPAADTALPPLSTGNRS